MPTPSSGLITWKGDVYENHSNTSNTPTNVINKRNEGDISSICVINVRYFKLMLYGKHRSMPVSFQCCLLVFLCIYMCIHVHTMYSHVHSNNTMFLHSTMADMLERNKECIESNGHRSIDDFITISMNEGTESR